jgi:hypothetical protein
MLYLKQVWMIAAHNRLQVRAFALPTSPSFHRRNELTASSTK